MSANTQTKITVLLLGTVLILSAVITGMYLYTVKLQSEGIVIVKTVNCKVFLDPFATQPIDAINWGSAPPETVLSQVVYIKNTGNSAANITVLTSNWNPPSMESMINFSAEIEGLNIPANGIAKCTFWERIGKAEGITELETRYAYTIDIIAQG